MNTENDTIFARFESAMHAQPQKTAVIFAGKQLTYVALHQQVLALSAWFIHNGVRMGDRIGVLLPNCLEFAIVMLAASRNGLVLVPQNLTLPPRLLVQSFGATGVTHLVCWHSVRESVNDAIPESGVSFSCEVIVGGDSNASNHLTQILESGEHSDDLASVVSPSQRYIFTMTSGSTGEPKPIVLSQTTKIRRAEAVAELYGVGGSDVVLAATPLYHSLAERLVLLPLMIGATCVIMGGFTARDWIETVSVFRVTFTMAVSSQLRQVLKLLQTESFDMTSLRCLVSSSELLDTTTRTQLTELLNCEFHECYGTSEVSCVTNIRFGENAHKHTSVGIPLKNVEIKIMGKDGREKCAGEVGEITCRTPLIFSGYYNRPEVTADAFSDGFFKTGDLGLVDDDGYLYFRGRAKDVVVTGGINVYPNDVEAVLLQHPDVKECAVVPMPDERLGEAVTAVLIPRTGDLKIRSLQRHCAVRLADYQQPQKYLFIDTLPKNAMGKIMKQTLIQSFLHEGARCEPEH